ncbi:hypothetical protein ABIB82_006949 [Bradyrhizobium sp. i1.8.4]|uniref:hypothetical protein n=1 Tax=unclassified Bradyrhizobium TaxID=2631580 RepID=UPI003D1B9146
MTDHGDTCPAAGAIAGAVVQSGFCTTAADTNRRRLELVRIDSSASRELFRSASPDSSIGERIMSQHDSFGGATTQSTRTATGAIEIMRRLGNIGLSLFAQRRSDLVGSVRKVA